MTDGFQAFETYNGIVENTKGMKNSHFSQLVVTQMFLRGLTIDKTSSEACLSVYYLLSPP